MIKDINPSALARQVKRLQKQLDAAGELRQAQTHAHERYREHAAKQLAEHLAKSRALQFQVDELKEHAIKDAFRLNDYRDQLAIQYRMVAEAKQDASYAIAQMKAQLSRINELESSKKKLQKELEHMEDGRQSWVDEYLKLRDKTPLWRIAWERFARWANV